MTMVGRLSKMSSTLKYLGIILGIILQIVPITASSKEHSWSDVSSIHETVPLSPTTSYPTRPQRIESPQQYLRRLQQEHTDIDLVHIEQHDDIQLAKDLLIGLGVPVSNLCIDPSHHNTLDADEKTANWMSDQLLLPICQDRKNNNEINSQRLSSRNYATSWMDWIFIPRQERRQRQQKLQLESELTTDLQDHYHYHHGIFDGRQLGEEESEIHSFEDDPYFFLTHAACALACVITAALAAGLTMGLLSLDPLMLLIKMRAGSTQKEKDQAAALLPIVKQHHLLLVTLLLLNSMANEALPLFLEVLVSPVVAVILSVTFVLFFGEIIPSAVFTGPQKIELASKMVPMVKLVMFLLWPIAYPIAKVLDVVLHEEEEGAENMNRGELSALVRVQYEERMAHKRARKLEKVQYQKRRSSLNAPQMSSIAGGAATTATLTGKATPTDVVVSKVSNTMIGPSRVGSLNFPHPKHRSFAADDAIRASKHEEFRSQHSGSTKEDYDQSRRSAGSGIVGSGSGGGGGEIKRSNSIHIDEVAMVEGALQMKTMTAMDILTPLHRIYAVPSDLILNENNIVDIYSSGFSRIPVYERDPDKPKSQARIIGLLMTKHLIVVNPNDNRPLATLPLQTPPCVSPKMNLVDMINLFQTGQVGHLALVCARPQVGEDLLCAGHALPSTAGFMGIITLEDVFEALLQEQIYDEMDQMEKEAEKIARWVCRKWKNYKAVKAEEDRKRLALGDVVDDAMRHADELKVGGSGTTPGESTFLLGKNKHDQNANSSGTGGILGFFQSLGGGSKDGIDD